MAKSWREKAKKRKKVGFNPDHNQVNSAVDAFLKSGGKIQKIKQGDSDIKELINRKGYPYADDFFTDW